MRCKWLLLLLLTLFFASCGKLECYEDKDCKGSFRCGPTFVCLTSCFQNQEDSCQKGFVCDAKGSACIEKQQP